jgi:hypothetical protein
MYICKILGIIEHWHHTQIEAPITWFKGNTEQPWYVARVITIGNIDHVLFRGSKRWKRGPKVQVSYKFTPLSSGGELVPQGRTLSSKGELRPLREKFGNATKYTDHSLHSLFAKTAISNHCGGGGGELVLWVWTCPPMPLNTLITPYIYNPTKRKLFYF